MIPLHDDNPAHLIPIVTVGVIALNVFAFLWRVSLGPAGDAAIYALGYIPAVVHGDASLPPALAVVPPEMTLVTSMFLHGGWFHLISNMLFLWVFGNNVEDAMGHARFLAFYLACGVAAALAQGVATPQSEIPMVGASGAVSGVLGAYFLLYPRAQVLVLVPVLVVLYPMYLRAIWVLGFYIVVQLLNGLMFTRVGGEEGGVAWWAHIGGFATGMVLVLVIRRKGFPLFGRVPARQDAGPWGPRAQ